MMIFMPYYRPHLHYFHAQSQNNSSTTSNGQNDSTVRLNVCQIASNILCRLAFSIFLLIMALFLLRFSIDASTNQNEGSPIIATILLTIAIVSFIRTYQKLKEYYLIMDTRRRLVQRLREQQEAYDFTLTLNNPETPGHVRNGLPSYKELFPSHLDLTRTTNEPLPSYEDYIRTLINPSTSTDSPSGRCLWITERNRRTPVCIRGTVTYV